MTKLVTNKKINNMIDTMIDIRLNNKNKYDFFRHIAAFYMNSDIIVIGINNQRELWNGCCYNRHAEMDATKNLHAKHKRNVIKTINLIVIRVSANKELLMSKPCANCLRHLNNIRSFRVKNIYYSNENGDIVVQSLLDMMESDDMYISTRFK